MKVWKIVPAALVGALLISTSVYAEDEGVAVDELKAQLAASASGKPATESLDQFTISESDLEQENSKLQAQEAEILEKLQPVEGLEEKPAVREASTTAFESAQPKGNEIIKMRGNVEERVLADEPAGEPVRQVEEKISNNKELAALKSSNSELNKKLSQSQDKLSSAQKDLREAKDRLMMAEAEVERLSQLLEKRGMVGLDKPRVTAPVRPAAAPVAPKAPEDLPVATVAVDKANLRTGPSTENSALMSVSRGTRLVIETRSGGWYRVFAPNGTRAWITGDVLSFNQNQSDSGVVSTLRVKAYDASAENESNRLAGRTIN